MLLQEPPESPYDLRFPLFGFPIRVSWSFWVGAVIFGFSIVKLMDRVILRDDGPGFAALFVLWAICLLLSILIHELGHALAFRQYGIESSIVLYHFGGLAIPRDSFGTGGSYSRLSAKQEMWIALAGPLAQICSAMLIVALMKWAGYRASAFTLTPLSYVVDWLPDGALDGDKVENAGLYAISTFYVWPSVVWGVLNLVPVWPLDGGRITRSLVLIGGGNANQSLTISLVCAGLMAAYGFANDNFFMGILFFSLAITNFQMLQQRGGWRY